jgi:aminopeptidase N
MRRCAALLIGLAVAVTACSGTGEKRATTIPATTTTDATSTSGLSVPPSTLDPSSGLTPQNPPGRLLGIGDDYFPQLGNPGYDVEHYTLDMVFEPDTTWLGAVATIAATATTDLATINLDFADLTVSAVFVDGVAAGFTAADEELTIAPAAPLVTGEEFVVDVEYSGNPRSAQSAAMPFGIGWQTAAGQNYVVAEPDAAHTWFPSNDHPLDKATYTFRINVPDDIVAAANGTLVDRLTDLGRATWVWELDSPMASYLATVVIGDFDIVEDAAAGAVAGVPIRHVLPAGTTVEDWPGLERQGEMIALLAELFGPYPFANYGIALVDGFGAALENQTLSLFDRNVAASFYFEDVLIHELAHQWFGNSVSLGRWADIWLNEGFASYAEWLWIEREDGRESMERDIATERDEYATAGLNAPGVPPSFDLFNGSVYRVGAMTLHALRLTVGDDAFFEILRTYTATFADGSVTTADFIAVAESVARVDLDGLFEAWLIEPGVPEFPQAQG